MIITMKKHEKFFAAEIGIEFKAALYFYSMLFFYIGYELISGSPQANIYVILEMIASTYIMGYIQVFLLGNFDEAENLTWKEISKAVGCSLIYAVFSYFLDWFDRIPLLSVIFFAFMIICFGCTYWLYSFRRSVSTKELNQELENFKQKKPKTDE